MLGLGGSITNRTKPPVFDFRTIRGLVGWWDFSVKHQSYMAQEDGSVVTNDTKIGTVKNLAFGLEKNTTRKKKALGKWLTSVSSNNRPTWFSADGGYAQFNSSESDRMITNKATQAGAVDTNQVSTSSVAQNNNTIFIVCKNDSSSLSGQENIFALIGDNEQTLQLVSASNLSKGWHCVNLEPPKTTTSTDTDQAVNASKVLITILKDSTDSNEMYLNGNTSLGTTSGAGGSSTMDMSQNQAATHVYLGGWSAVQCWNGRLYEIVIFNRALNTREVRKIEKFLLKKHNI